MSNKTHLLIPFLVVSISLFGLMVWSAEAAPTASIIVTTEMDELDGALGNKECSLREAIQNLNLNNQGQGDCGSGATFNAISLPVGVYTLTRTGALIDENGNLYGDLDILDDLTITGAGYKATYIQAGTADPTTNACIDCIDRVLDIDGATVVLNDLTIQFGKAPDGDYSVTSATGSFGGGIRNSGGNLKLVGCGVSRNKAGNGEPGYDASGGFGGGIVSDGTLELVNTLVSGNEAGDGSTGIGFPGVDGGIGGSGGGIYLFSSEVMTATNSRLLSNYAGNGGSADNTEGMNAGEGGSGGKGGGLYNGGIVSIINSTISSNYGGNGAPGGDATGSGSYSGGDGGNGGHGGGIYSYQDNASIQVISSTISDNWTGVPGRGGNGTGSNGTSGYRGAGGGLANGNGNCSIVSSTLSDNHASSGGGIFNDENLIVINSTISNNRAYDVGGGIYTGGSSNTDFIFSTITDNTADVENDGIGDGGGIYNSTGTITITNTILAENNDKSPNDSPDCKGTIHSGDYNFIGDDSGTLCTFLADTNDLVGTLYVPGLDDLADNGGPTETHAR